MHNIKIYCVLFLLVMSLDLEAATDNKPQNIIEMSLGNNDGLPNDSYWQQKLDYKIIAKLEPKNKYLTASAEVTYYNNSPTDLLILWFELPQQRFKEEKQKTSESNDIATKYLQVTDKYGTPLKVVWRGTFFSIEPTQPIKARSEFVFHFSWDLTLINRSDALQPRSGFETFDEDKFLFGVAQWFPRAVAYSAARGWSLTPFLGKGEFSLELADYDVEINLPSNYLVLATGQLKNPDTALSKKQYKQWLTLTDTPVFISSSVEESKGKLKNENKKWHFEAYNVRDFSFAAGNNLIWQSQKIKVLDKSIRLNVSYPDNGRWLWHQYALPATRHSVNYLTELLGVFPFKTLNVVNITGISMEYPGIKFVGFRGPNVEVNKEEIKYTRTEKYDVIGGIIHEVAHSYFPMTVNTDERLEGFFDEGLTSYLSYLVEQAWNPNFQSFYGKPYRVFEANHKVDYSAPYQLADKVSNKLDSHYHVPAVAFNVLNKLVLEKHNFNEILANFIKQWRSKRAYFKDFENFVSAQSNENLQWFWHYWFETNKRVDLSIDNVELISASESIEFPTHQTQHKHKPQENIAAINYAIVKNTAVSDPSQAKLLGNSFEGLNLSKQDQYTHFSDDVELAAFHWEMCAYSQMNNSHQILSSGVKFTVNNIGGIPSPIELKVILNNGESLNKKWPVEYWLINIDSVKSKKSLQLEWLFEKNVKIKCVVVDPRRMTGDTQRENNYYAVP
ncbi:M1 family aminopeptidase [Colwellia sp. RSH04]|uniref:M1 family aminopeptidase n=1 Tax=Colwellia sp. RSH04 TaxID=2305464 RepID=UPI000E56B67E|nr:M1 family aminopeptidase [Colwellia sp. RSH04]RHW76476.1 M1 family peptidase [Colwellia sp. RSH04]